MATSERYPRTSYSIDFTADELILNYKYETQNDDCKIQKLSDNIHIDRSSRCEVYEFIKKYMIARKCTMLSTFRKIEMMIVLEAPESRLTLCKLKKWLDENFLV